MNTRQRPQTSVKTRGRREGRGWKTAPVPAVKALRRSNTLVNRLEPRETPDESTAEMVVSGLAINAVTAAEFSKYPFGDVDLTECLIKLYDAVGRVHRGDLREAEALLMAQAVTLNTIFTHLANLAAKTQYDDKLDCYLRLALKAQGQCCATLETLAEIKNPPLLFARQANVAHRPQQVNNVVSVARRDDQPTRAENQEDRPIEQLEAYERVDRGAARTASGSDPPVATVGALNGPADG